jgi:hypothetical protein
MFHQKGPGHGGKSNMVCWITPFFNGGVDGNIIYAVVAGNTNYKWLYLVMSIGLYIPDMGFC